MAKLWRKSLLFEIFNMETETVELQYTLTIPPESIETHFPQRVQRTKTFGGVFIDDYGEDNPKITISGTTGGVTVRESWPNHINTGLDGRDAIFELRNKIIRYKRRLGNDYTKYCIRMYDLSSGDFDIVNNRLANLDAYECSLEDFRITRNKEKPLWYNYSIELFVTNIMGTYKPRNALPEYDPIMIYAGLNKGMAKIDIIQEALNKLVSDAQGVMDICNSVFKAYDSAAKQVKSYIDQVASVETQLIQFPGVWMKNALARVNELGTYISNIPDAIKEFGTETANIYESMILDFQELLGSSSASVAASKSLGEASRAIGSSTELMSSVEASRSDTTVVTRSLVFSGNAVATITGSSTFEDLATQYYGDPSMAVFIAQYNGVSDIDELQPGGVLKIPILTTDTRVLDNQVYDYDHLDLYGSDIAIDENGAIIIAESSDVASISGVDNLVQAMNLRFSEELGARIRLTTYGLVSAVGSPYQNNAPIAYIVASIVDTAMQDPRVKDISNISINGSGDTMYYSFDITGIGGDNTTVSGAF